MLVRIIKNVYNLETTWYFYLASSTKTAFAGACTLIGHQWKPLLSYSSTKDPCPQPPAGTLWVTKKSTPTITFHPQALVIIDTSQTSQQHQAPSTPSTKKIFNTTFGSCGPIIPQFLEGNSISFLSSIFHTFPIHQLLFFATQFHLPFLCHPITHFLNA